MKIGSIRHKGLRRLYDHADAVGLPPPYADKIRKMLSSLSYAVSIEDLKAFPIWRVHQLGGDRKGTWSLHVSANWRLTFRIAGNPPEVIDLDFEDYH
jgi:proteic killer suppression protein